MAISASSTILASDVTTALGKKIDTAGTGLSKSGTTLALATVVTAGNAGPTANATLSYGGTFTVPYVTYDAYGRVTGRTNRTMTMPSAPSSATTATKATAIPNVVVAYGKTQYGGTVSGNYVKLPSGGTWRYVRCYGVAVSVSDYVKQVSGGTKILVYSDSGDSEYTYSFIAIRVA